MAPEAKGKTITVEISADKLASLETMLGLFPEMETKFSTLEDKLEEKHVEEMLANCEQIAKVSEKPRAYFMASCKEMEAAKERVEVLTEKLEETLAKVERDSHEFYARAKALAAMTEEVIARPWTWKRVTWAIISGVAGGGLAWWLNGKQPIINHASAGIAMSKGMRFMGVPNDHATWLGGANGALLSSWAGGEKGAMPALSIALAGYGYGEAIFATGEASRRRRRTSRIAADS